MSGGRTTLLALQEAEAAQRLAETVTVLAQPHRQGDTSELCESVFGRFVLQHKCGRECYEGGMEYFQLVYRWRRAKGIPNPMRLHEAGNSAGGDLDEEILAQWGVKIKDCEKAMVRAGKFQGFRAANALILDDREVWSDMLHPVKRAIHSLAIELGRFPY